MVRGAKSHRLSVCLLASHPLVHAEFQRRLPDTDFRLYFRQLDSALPSELRRLSVPRAQVYVVDAQTQRAGLHALIENILEHYPQARVLVLAEKHAEPNSFPLLRLGVRGLLNYGMAEDQWPQAVRLAASGGYWVPRAILSRFVESIVGDSRSRSLKAKVPGSLSRREREVMDALLQNLSNKEIASRLNISERTVKFHVSNLLAKYGVRRRADLIVLRFQEEQLPI